MTSVDDDRVMAGFRDYAGKFAMPVMLLAVGTRFVLKIKQTADWFDPIGAINFSSF